MHAVCHFLLPVSFGKFSTLAHWSSLMSSLSSSTFALCKAEGKINRKHLEGSWFSHKFCYLGISLVHGLNLPRLSHWHAYCCILVTECTRERRVSEFDFHMGTASSFECTSERILQLWLSLLHAVFYEISRLLPGILRKQQSSGS